MYTYSWVCCILGYGIDIAPFPRLQKQDDIPFPNLKALHQGVPPTHSPFFDLTATLSLCYSHSPLTRSKFSSTP